MDLASFSKRAATAQKLSTEARGDVIVVDVVSGATCSVAGVLEKVGMRSSAQSTRPLR